MDRRVEPGDDKRCDDDVRCDDALMREACVFVVTRGLDPRVHLFARRMDRRVKPGDDEW
jgi:hypothetical protein